MRFLRGRLTGRLLLLGLLLAWPILGLADPDSPAVAAGRAELSAGGMLVRVGLALALVLGILGTVLFLYRRATRGAGRARAGRAIELVAQHSLGPRTSLALVRVAGETLLIGITPQQVSPLGRLATAAPGVEGVEFSPAQAQCPAPPRAAPAVVPETASAPPRPLPPAGAPFDQALQGELRRVRRHLLTAFEPPSREPGAVAREA